MATRYSDDDIEEFKIRRAFRDAEDGYLVDQAFRDILSGQFDSDAVHQALKIGHHEDHQRLKDARSAAVSAALHAGAL